MAPLVSFSSLWVCGWKHQVSRHRLMVAVADLSSMCRGDDYSVRLNCRSRKRRQYASHMHMLSASVMLLPLPDSVQRPSRYCSESPVLGKLGELKPLQIEGMETMQHFLQSPPQSSRHSWRGYSCTISREAASAQDWCERMGPGAVSGVIHSSSLLYRLLFRHVYTR